jgi:hypothetical protein
MELTKDRRNFFADLDLDKALAAGGGKVHFDFPHKGHAIAVEAYSSCDADIIVRRKAKDGVVHEPDKRLSMFNIPDTTNVSAQKVLRMVYEEATKPVDSQLKQAWLDTPYVERWYVSVRGSYTEFSTNTEEARYLIKVTESPDDESDTVAELFMSGAQIHTFTISQPYHNEHTAHSLLNLADAITEAWRDAVLAQYDEGESK